MSPEQTASVAVLARLRQEIATDRSGLSAHEREASELQKLWAQSPSRGDIARAAVALHAWYTGLETLLERIARQLDREVPSGNDWHRELLSQCAAEIPSVRPAVLPNVLLKDLTSLLSFRHFFRHAYSVELDPAQLKAQLDRLVEVARALAVALDVFDAFVRDAISHLSAKP